MTDSNIISRDNLLSLSDISDQFNISSYDLNEMIHSSLFPKPFSYKMDQLLYPQSEIEIFLKDGDVSNIFDVSKYILDTIGAEISAPKLQKLCFYSQAWHLVWNGLPLFHENFIKSDNGPLSPDLFNLHQGLFYVSSKIVPTSLLSKSGLSYIKKFNIEQILDDYGKYSAVQLSELSQSEEPCQKTEKNKIIPRKKIKDFYSSLSDYLTPQYHGPYA
jgi:uncharacterized phage-associated protein